MGAATVTINAVDTSKAYVVGPKFVSVGSAGSANSQTREYYGNHWIQAGYGYGYGYGKAGGSVKLTNSTTVVVSATDANTTSVWEVVEYE